MSINRGRETTDKIIDDILLISNLVEFPDFLITEHCVLVTQYTSVSIFFNNSHRY